MKKTIKFIKTNIYFHLFIILILFLSSSWWYLNINDNYYPGFQKRWFPCMQYIEEGTLYGGQPYCVQGPVVYLTGFFISKIFGIESLYIISKILVILLNVALFFLIYKVLKKELQKTYFLILTLLYFFFVFYLSQDYLESMLSTFFLFSGFYLLFYTNTKYKELFSGIFFTLSFFSKISSALGIGFIILYYLYKKYKLNFNKELFRNLIPKFIIKDLIFFSSSFIIVWILIFLYSSIAWRYILPTLLRNDVKLPLKETLPLLFPLNLSGVLNIELLGFYIILIFSLYGLIKYRNLFFWMYIPFLITTFNILQAYGSSTGFNYYTMQFNPFIIIGLIFIADSINFKKLNLKEIKVISLSLIFIFILIFFVIYPYISVLSTSDLLTNDYMKQQREFRNYIDKPLKWIPEQSGKVLIEERSPEEVETGLFGNNQNVFLEFDEKIIKNSEILSWYWIGIDCGYDINACWWKDVLPDVNLSKWIRRPNMKVQADAYVIQADASETFLRLVEGKYSLIVVGPPNSLDIIIILDLVGIRPTGFQYDEKLTKIFSEVLKIKQPPGYCRVEIPTEFHFNKGGKRSFELYFTDVSHCIFMVEESYKYYNEIFDDVCKLSQDVANDILSSFNAMKIPFDKKCNSNFDPIFLFSSRLKVNNFQILLALFIFILTLLVLIGWRYIKIYKMGS